MKHTIKLWSVEEIYKKRDRVQFPDYQREPNVWTEQKRRLLIDSIINDIPIPPLFLYKQPKNILDCVDGRQRFESIFSFFDGELAIKNYGKIDSVPDNIKNKINDYELIFVILEDIKEIDLRKIFIRLQLGSILNAGEKLNASYGKMKDFVFETAKKHPFFKNISIPSRRFAKEQMLAQICINSFELSLNGRYQSARFDKLLKFFEMYVKLDRFQKEKNTILKTIDLLNKILGKRAKEFTNRAIVLTAYLFVEDLLKRNRPEKEIRDFVDFYILFINKVKEEAKKGLDYDPNFRKILDFYTYVTQAAFEPYAIERRNKIVKEYFAHYENVKKEIKRG